MGLGPPEERCRSRFALPSYQVGEGGKIYTNRKQGMGISQWRYPFDCRSRRVSNPPLYDVLEGRVLERLLSEHIIKSWCRDCGSSWLTGPASNLYTNTHTDTPSPPSLTKEAKPVCMRNSIIVSDGRTPYNHLSKTTDSPRM